MKTTEARRIALRKRLLGIIPRSVLDQIAEVERPWTYDRPALTEVIALQWPQADIENQLVSLIRRAS